MKITAPHWILALAVILGLVAPHLPTLDPQSAPLSGASTFLVQVMPLILGALGFAAPSIATSINAAAVRRAAARPTAANVSGLNSTLLFLMVFLCLTCLFGCTKQQGQTIQSVDQVGLNLTNAVCSLAPTAVGQTNAPNVEVVCAVAQGVEQTVNVVVGLLDQGDGGLAAATTAPTLTTMTVPVTQIRFLLPAPAAQSFLAAQHVHP
jgi:hypothetical protein